MATGNLLEALSFYHTVIYICILPTPGTMSIPTKSALFYIIINNQLTGNGLVIHVIRLEISIALAVEVCESR